MHYDEWAEASDFRLGESVIRPYGPFPSPLRGTVVAIHPKINKLDVQWPTQTMRMDPWDICSTMAYEIANTVSEGLRPVVEEAKKASIFGAALRRQLKASFPQVSVANLDTVIAVVDKRGAPPGPVKPKPTTEEYQEQKKKKPQGKADWTFDVDGEARSYPGTDYLEAERLVSEYAKGNKKNQVKLVSDGKAD